MAIALAAVKKSQTTWPETLRPPAAAPSSSRVQPGETAVLVMAAPGSGGEGPRAGGLRVSWSEGGGGVGTEAWEAASRPSKCLKIKNGGIDTWI